MLFSPGSSLKRMIRPRHEGARFQIARPVFGFWMKGAILIDSEARLKVFCILQI